MKSDILAKSPAQLQIEELLYRQHALLDQMKKVALDLPEAPTGGMCPHCAATDEWEYVEEGHTRISHCYWIEPPDMRSTAFQWRVEESADDFSEFSEPAFYMQCGMCSHMFRKPDDVHWS